MGKFRSKHLQLLVATDVAARGLDVDDLTHIINYNLPDENDVYIHRSGRTGRAGKSGISLSILHMREKHKLRAVEKMIGRKFDKLLVPSGKEICEKQLFKLVENVEKVEIDESQIAPFLDVIYKKLEWLNREDLIKKFVSVEFNRFLSYYKGAKDLNQVCDPREERKPRQPKERRDRSERQTEFGFSRLFINLGSSTNLNPSSLIGLINQYTRERNIDIGRIEIMKNFSFFEVDSSFEKIILKAFKDASFNDIPIVAELANPKQSIQNTKTPSNFTRKENFKRKENFSKRKKIGKKRRD